MSILAIWFLLSKPVQKTKPALPVTCDKINCGHGYKTIQPLPADRRSWQ